MTRKQRIFPWTYLKLHKHDNIAFNFFKNCMNRKCSEIFTILLSHKTFILISLNDIHLLSRKLCIHMLVVSVRYQSNKMSEIV